jgi:hypothetical protein
MQNNTVTIRKDLIIGLLIGIIVLLVGYIFLKDQFKSGEVATLPVQTESQTEEETTIPAAPAEDWSIESNGPNIKKFIWNAKGLSFTYSPYVYLETEEYFGPDLEHLITDPTVDVAGRLIFPRGSLEVFDKVATDTPEKAVRAQFLGGSNTATCTVKRVYQDEEDFVYLPQPGVTFVRMKGSGCPQLYKSDASLSTTFFVLDSVPDKLFFVTTSDGENVSLRLSTGAPFFASFVQLSEVVTNSGE